MRWKIVLEGTDEFGSAHRSELTINKDLERVSAGEIGFSVEDGKIIMAHLHRAAPFYRHAYCRKPFWRENSVCTKRDR